MAVQFNYAARSDVGLVRKNNQDSGYAGSHLLVLADGMGGPAGGDIASSVAVAHLAALDEDPVPADAMLPRLREALQSAHNEMIERSEVDSQLRGLGTTCIALLRSGNKLAMVHIGDSRAYLFRNGELTQITTDHSFVQYLVDTGQITAEEAETHPKRSVILRVLGDGPGTVVADETVREAVTGDRWLLCSDGLSGVVSSGTIAEVLGSVADPSECAEKLIQLALLGGAPDNVTCVIADVVSVGDADSTVPQIVGAAAVDRAAPSRRGGGAAGKAAALVLASSSGSEADDDEGDDPQRRHRRLRWVALTLLLAFLILLGVGGAFALSWSKTQYYAIGSEGAVVIYQGIPQALGPWELSQPVEVTDLRLADLSVADQQRLEDPVTRSSLKEMQEYLAELEQRAAGLKDDTERPQSDDGQSGGIRSAEQAKSVATPSPTVTQELRDD